MSKFDVILSDILPLFKKIIKDPTTLDIMQLDDLLQRCKDVFSGEIFNDMLLPLLYKIDCEKISEIQWKLLATLEVFLKRINIDTKDSFSTILMVLLKKFYDFKSGNILELQSSIFMCIKTLLRSTSKDVIKDFFSAKNTKFVISILTTCIEMIEPEFYDKLKQEIIDCILHLLNADEDDIVLRSQVGNAINILLPTMLKMALGNSIQGHQLIAVSAKLVRWIIFLIHERTDDFKKLMIKEGAGKENKDTLKFSLGELSGYSNLQKNREWISSVAEKLKPYLAKLLIFSQNDDEMAGRDVTLTSKL